MAPDTWPQDLTRKVRENPAQFLRKAFKTGGFLADTEFKLQAEAGKPFVMRLEEACLPYLGIDYWRPMPAGRSGNVRVVTEPISLGLAVELAVWDARSPGIVIVDSEGSMYRVTSHEWEVRNKLLQDLYEDLLEGRIRRLTYPRVDEHEEYYRERAEYQLKNPDLWDSLSSGDVPLWELLNVVDRSHIAYRTWKTVTQ